MKHNILLLIIFFLLKIGIPNCYSQKSLSDLEGNKYYTVTIGTQIWMAENLKTTKFNDGQPIPLFLPPDKNAQEYIIPATPFFCWYDNDEVKYKDKYGALYNWYSVNTGKLCPTGWHVPTDAEWSKLIEFLGGKGVAGAKLRDLTWKAYDYVRSTNESGFSALQGGNCLFTTYSGVGRNGSWWSSSELSVEEALNYELTSGTTAITIFSAPKYWSNSVRCIKD